MRFFNLSKIIMKARKLVLFLATISVSNALDYSWTNMTANGSLGTNSGYDISSPSNWNTAPVFNDTTSLLLLNGTGNTTIFAGNATRVLNSLTTSNTGQWRINSASSTLNFAGSDPTIDVQSGSLRLEVKLNAAGGITKNGAGLVFSNLQSVSSGFTGPLTIAAGTWQAGNNYALGDQKTVNILTGGTLNMSSLSLGSNAISGGSIVDRRYTLNISGNGLGQGAVTNSASILGGFSGIYNLNLTADAAVGGTGAYDIGFNGGVIDGNGYTLTKLGTGQVWMRGAASDISFQVSEGTLVASDHASSLGGSGGSVSVANGATLASSGNISLATPASLASGATLSNLSGSSTWSGSVSLGAGATGVTVTGGSGANTTISGVISGNSGNLNKSGANTLTLSNQNTYSGITRVNQGTLAIAATGSIGNSSEIRINTGSFLNVAAVSAFEVGAGQSLTGGGTVVGDVSISGIHSPGFSPGIQSFADDLSYSVGSSITWELIDNTIASAARGVSYDGINVAGNLSFTGTTLLDLVFNSTGSNVDWTNSLWSGYVDGTNGWKLFDVTGSISGLENLKVPSSATLLDSKGVSISSVHPSGVFYLTQQSGGVYLNYAVPEPAASLLGGLAFLFLLRRRR